MSFKPVLRFATSTHLFGIHDLTDELTAEAKIGWLLSRMEPTEVAQLRSSALHLAAYIQKRQKEAERASNS